MHRGKPMMGSQLNQNKAGGRVTGLPRKSLNEDGATGREFGRREFQEPLS